MHHAAAAVDTATTPLLASWAGVSARSGSDLVGSATVETDEALFEAARGGEADAFDRLIERYRRPLYGFLWRRVSGDVDDLFQETWLRVVRSMHRYDAARRFSTWLYQIANNLCRDRARRLAADRRRREGNAERLDAAVDGQRPEELHDLPRLLGLLGDEQREVLVLRYYEQRSEAETAKILGIPRGTVKSRLHAAVTRLRRELSA